MEWNHKNVFWRTWIGISTLWSILSLYLFYFLHNRYIDLIPKQSVISDRNFGFSTFFLEKKQREETFSDRLSILGFIMIFLIIISSVSQFHANTHHYRRIRVPKPHISGFGSSIFGYLYDFFKVDCTEDKIWHKYFNFSLIHFLE